MQEKLYDATPAADFIGIRPQTLAVWRLTNRYDLPFVRVGRRIKYRERDLIAFLDRHTVRPNAEPVNA